MDKKSEILAAARELIARFGLKRTTTDDIAQKARVSKATVYRYFNNKEEIFKEICVMEVDNLWEMVNKAVAREISIRNKLKAHLTTKIEAVHGLIEFYNVTPDLWNEYLPYIRLVQERTADREVSLLAGILKEGNDSGELQVKRVDTIAYIMVTALKALENPWVLNRQPVPLSEYIMVMLDALLYGIAKR